MRKQKPLLTQRLQDVRAVHDLVQKKAIRWDPSALMLGMAYMKRLRNNRSNKDKVKAYPCAGYFDADNPVEFGIKICPLERCFPFKTGPTRMEAGLMRLTNQALLENWSPHLTMFFTDFDVKNSAPALTKFPLKELDIHSKCSVLVTEFVPGGSLDHYMDDVKYEEKDNLTTPQWLSLLFSVIWTLHVLQDRWQMMHNDFHYGNILIDIVRKEPKRFIQYELVDTQGKTHKWYLPVTGLLFKLWDFEYGQANDAPEVAHLQSADGSDKYFDKVSDLHFFLTTLLEIDALPVHLQVWIHSLYPPELIPEKKKVRSRRDSPRHDDSGRQSGRVSGSDTDSDSQLGTDSGSQSSNQSGDDCQSDCSCEFKHMRYSDRYYYTDEDISTVKTHSDIDVDTEMEIPEDFIFEEPPKRSYTPTSSVFLRHGQLRTKALDTFGVHLPTPMDLLTSDLFAPFMQVPKRGHSAALKVRYRVRGNREYLAGK